MNIEIKIEDSLKEIKLEAVQIANHGDVFYRPEPQHINYFVKMRFNRNSASDQRCLKRGLLFLTEADAKLFVARYLGVEAV